MAEKQGNGCKIAHVQTNLHPGEHMGLLIYSNEFQAVTLATALIN